MREATTAAVPPPASPRRRLAAVAVGAAVLAVIGGQAAEGARFTRQWAGEPHRSQAAAVDERAACLARAITERVPASARVHVPMQEALSVPGGGGIFFLDLVEHAYRRATLVATPEEADLRLGVVETPGAGCDGYDLTVTEG